jgi:hypothetical protein
MMPWLVSASLVELGNEVVKYHRDQVQAANRAIKGSAQGEGTEEITMCDHVFCDQDFLFFKVI